MPGTRLLSHFQIGKETVKGTPVAASRMFYPDLSSAFTIDRGLTLHEGRYTGTRTNVSYGTRQLERVDIAYRTPDDTGIGFSELPYFLIFPGGGTAGSGATAFTWAHAWGGTATGSAVSYTVEYGDDTQNYEAEYVQASRLRISASQDGMTNFEAEMFGRQSTKSTKTALAATNPVRIPGYLWQPRWQTTGAGLSTATAVPNFLREWEADWTTGLVPHFYADGADYFGQSVESAPVRGTVRLVVDSNSTAVSQFYDKADAATVDFLRLSAIGASLGATAYTAILEFGLIYTDVSLLDSEMDGVNTYAIDAEIVYDATWTKSIGATVVCDTAAL